MGLSKLVLLSSALCCAVVINALDIGKVNSPNAEKLQKQKTSALIPEKPEEMLTLYGQKGVWFPEEYKKALGEASLPGFSYSMPFFGSYGFQMPKPKVLVSLPTTEKPDFSKEILTAMPPLTPQQQQYVNILNLVEGKVLSGPQQTIPSGVTIPT